MMSRRPRLWTLPVFAVAAVLLGYLVAQGGVRAAAELGAEALVKEAGAACQIASELEQSRVLWSSPSYEHYAALILAGTMPANAAGDDEAETYMLCLFNKQTAKVELQSIEATLFR